MKSLLGMLVLGTSLLYAQQFQIGSKVDDFSITDLSGKSTSFHSLKGDVTVLVFTSTMCPVSNAYNERMNALYKDYSGKGVKFIFLNANANEAPAEVAEHAKVNFSFPVYKDPGNVVADRFGAQVTPETYVIDKDGVLRYHGAIDDQRTEARVQLKGLRLALDSVLTGKPVETTQTKAFGCTIKRARKTS
jgi:peroxiredoxin